MSRVGKNPISVPSGVSFSHDGGTVTVKGPKGELAQSVDPAFKFELEDGQLTVSRPSDAKPHRAKHGLYRALVSNMVEGVTEGYKQSLELIGIGYRAEVKGNVVEFSVGYSHPVFFVLPPEVKAESEYQKGQTPKLHLTCIDKQLLGQVVAKIRAIRPPEPYKGKGIRIVGEYVRRKAGKTSKK